ncbi:MAG: hypothetical protein HOH05_15415, partial [Marinovum sp.]|nr:hypothetical protein [Marinovum sp.]
MGTVVKGPLYNAQVFLDYNGDGAWSEGEPTTYTSPNGTFSLTATDKTAQIIALTTPQTIDASSGTSLGNATLKAEAGSSVITPVTTMIVETNLTSSQVAQALGLPSGVDYSHFNPYALGVDAEVAIAVENAGQKIISTITTFASTMERAGVPSANALDAASRAMADLIEEKSGSSESLDLNNPMVLEDFAQLLEDKSNFSFEQTDLDAARDGVAAVNQQIDTVKSLGSEYSQGIYSIINDLRTEAASDSGITISLDTDFNAIIENSAPTRIDLVEYGLGGPTRITKEMSFPSDSNRLAFLDVTDDSSTGYSAFEFELTGTDANLFEIGPEGQLLYRFSPQSDSKLLYNFTINVQDEGGLSYAQDFVIVDGPVSILQKIPFNQENIKGVFNGENHGLISWTENSGIGSVSEVFLRSLNSDQVFNGFTQSHFSETNNGLLLLGNEASKLILFADVKTTETAKKQIAFSIFDMSQDGEIQRLNGSEFKVDNTIETYATSTKTVILSNINYSIEEAAAVGNEAIRAGEVKTPALETYSPADYTGFGDFEDGIYLNESQISATFSEPAVNGNITATLTGTWVDSVETVAQYDSHFLALSDSEFVVTWTQSSLSGLDCFAQIFGSDGYAQKPPFLVSAQPYNTITRNVVLRDVFYTYEEAAADETGQINVGAIKTLARDTLYLENYTGEGFFVSGISVPADQIDPIFSEPASDGSISVTLKAHWATIAATDEYDARVSALGDDKFIISWVKSVGTNTDIKAKIFNIDGSVEVDEFQINVASRSSEDLPENINYHPVFVETPDGFTVVWFSYDDAGDSPNLMARTFNLEGVPKEFVQVGAVIPEVDTFFSSYSPYRNVNDKINISITFDNNEHLGTALSLKLNNGVCVTVSRSSTAENMFNGSFIIGPNDTTVLDLEVSEILVNTNQRLVYSEDIKVDKYGDIFSEDPHGNPILNTLNLDVYDQFSAVASGNEIFVIHSASSFNIASGGLDRDIFASKFNLEDLNWANSFEVNRTLVSESNYSNQNNTPQASLVQDGDSISLSVLWEGSPQLSFGDTFQFDIMSAVYSEKALLDFTQGVFSGPSGLKDYMSADNFEGQNLNFPTYKSLSYVDRSALLDNERLEAYFASLGTDLYSHEITVNSQLLPVASFSRSGHTFDAETGVLVLSGSDFTSVDIKELDWSKLSWAIDGASEDTIFFQSNFIDEENSQILSDTELHVTLSVFGLNELLTANNFGGKAETGGIADSLSIGSGFLKNSDGVSSIEPSAVLVNQFISFADETMPVLMKLNDKFFNASPDTGYRGTGGDIVITATLSEDMQAGTSFFVTLNTGAVVRLSRSEVTASEFTGTYTISADDPDVAELLVTSYATGNATDLSGNALMSDIDIRDYTDMENPSSPDYEAGARLGTIVIDRTAPALTGFSATPNSGALGTGDEIIITATVAENMQADTGFKVTLNTGAEILLTRKEFAADEFLGTYTIAVEDTDVSDLLVLSYAPEDAVTLSGKPLFSDTDITSFSNLGDIIVDRTIPALIDFSASPNSGAMETGDEIVITA